MSLWRNHAKMNLKTEIAARYAKNIFYTSPYACTRVFHHAIQMPVGIDTHLFQPKQEVVRHAYSVVFLGRLSPVKHPELFIDACRFIPMHDAAIYGDDPIGNKEYEYTLKERAQGEVSFHGSIPNYRAPEVYSAFDVYINLTPEGSMDKTVLEAAACGALVLVSNKSFKELVPEKCLITDTEPHAIALQLAQLYALERAEKDQYRLQLQRMVCEKHSLNTLAKKLVEYMST